MRRIDITGRKFGKLTVHRITGKRSSAGQIYWICDCDCGNSVEVLGAKLRNGHTQSCGCLQKERASKSSTSHGMAGTSEYQAWSHLKGRCLDESNREFQYYGGRGIGIWDYWIESFECFYYWMGDKPGPEYSIDRIDNDGDYVPWNCRWATKEQQMNNQSKNVFITFRGKTLTLAQWSRKTGIPYKKVWRRYHKGWLPNDIFSS